MKDYRIILHCCGYNLEYHENANGYSLVSLPCKECSDKMFCNRIRGIVENDINMHKVKTIGQLLATPLGEILGGIKG